MQQLKGRHSTILSFSFLLLSASLSAGQVYTGEHPASSKINISNQPPSVKISTPTDKSFFEWNSNIEYAIKVSDAEDGESDRLDIASNEVFLEVIYFPDASIAKDKSAYTHFDSPGLQLLMKADCFNCHAVKTSIQGPAFIEIANKYPHTPGTIKMLAQRVVEGSSGVWGISAMASHPELTLEQAGQIVQWLLENAQDPNRNYYSGTKGAFQTKSKAAGEKEGVYMLTAAYADRGVKDMPHLSKKGVHSILLRSK